MSPPSQQQLPRTPDRRSSSSALFGAFRSLTAGRLKSPTPPPSTSPATCTPARTASLASRTTTSPGLHAADDALKRINEHAVPRHARPVIGGPPELDALVAQLDQERPFAERAAAIDNICPILAAYDVQNVLQLWSRASDLLLPEQPDAVADAGYALLKACVALPKLSALERSVFFDAASLRKHDARFHRRLDIVSTLTKGGRDIEACESLLPHFILAAYDACFKQSVDALHAQRKSSAGKKSAGQPVKELENMDRLFRFTIDVCKFNAKIFHEGDLELLVRKIMSVCQETTQARDIANAVTLFDTVITYVHVPDNVLRPCLEVLGAVYYQLPDFREQTWNTLSNLFKSHVGQAAISALLRTLVDGPLRRARESHRESSAYRGTKQVLQQLILEDGRNALPTVPVTILLPALEASIKNQKSQEDFVVDLVNALLSQDRLKESLLTETDWSHLLSIIHTCAERDDERLRAHMGKTTKQSTAPTSDKDPSPSDKTSSASDKYSSANGPAALNAASAASTNGDQDTDVISNLDLTVLPPHPEHLARDSENGIFNVLMKLDQVSNDLDFVQKHAVMELFMRLAHRLSDSTAENLINYYTRERCLHPSDAGWLENCRGLASGILKDVTRPRSLRILSIQALRETYTTVETLCRSDLVVQCGALLWNMIEAEEDVVVLFELVDFAVDVADRALHDEFLDMMGILKTRLERCAAVRSSADNLTRSISHHAQANRSLGSTCNVIATAFVRLFLRSVKTNAPKTRMLYEVLRHIAGGDSYETDARLTVLRLLFRLRADSEHAIVVSASAEGESLAAVLCRTEATASATENEEGEQSKAEEQSPKRDSRKVSNSPHNSLSRHVTRHSSAAGRAPKPASPLWMYPGPKGLPEEPPPEVSRVVFSHIDAEHYPLSDDVLDLEVSLWLELIISLLQANVDWEIYSYALVHLGPQLSNQALVRSCIPQLKLLRSVICERIRNSSFREPPSYTLLKKADIAVCLFHILTVLISYHTHYEKSEEDDLVKAFIHGIGNWDKTSKWCIHALSVCCHEVPLSVSKSLDTIIQKMSQIVTKPATAIHILDFLTSLARMPDLYKNFREDEFKMVFGVSFRYLQHIRDQRERASSSQNGHRSLRHSGPSRDFASSPDQQSKGKTPEDDLPHYLYSLAYHVITFWFMALKMEDRPKLMPWIARSLRFTDGTGRLAELEEQGQVIVDMMSVVGYSDRDETMRDANFAQPGDGQVWKKSWIVGHSLITIETAGRTGVSQVTMRRPCGTRFLSVRPLLAPPPRHQAPLTVGLASETFYSDSYLGILPDDIFQSFYAPLNFSLDPPVALPDDDMMRRALGAFDRISAVDSYKVGVIYIGEGQTDERDILMNDVGSPAYTSFVSDLGTLCRLQGAQFNTGGLDTHNNMDGEFTYCWRDRCIELVFHITTMMPTNRDDDMTYANKKRHIGNDFVNIIFNDSGLPYSFGTFPSDFDYVYIVISPESRASFVRRRLDADPDGKDRYYKVQAISRPGFPDISPAAEPKLIAGKYLAAYCRLIAINASVFAQVWSARDGGESVSSWRSRLREIKRLRDRYGSVDALPAASPVSPGLQGLSSPSSREGGLAAGFKRSSVAAFAESVNRGSEGGG